MCFHWQPCTCNRLGLCLLSLLKLWQTNTTGDSCDGEISVLNHCLSWSKFVNTHLYHSRQWFNLHISRWPSDSPVFIETVHLYLLGVHMPMLIPSCVSVNVIFCIKLCYLLSEWPCFSFFFQTKLTLQRPDPICCLTHAAVARSLCDSFLFIFVTACGLNIWQPVGCSSWCDYI